MKTTVEIADVLMTELKIKAMREKKTLRVCLETAISEYLKPKPKHKPYKMRDLSFKGGKGLAPGLDLDNKEQIRAILDEDRRR